MWAPFEATLVNLGSKNISSFAVTTRNVCRGITRIFTCTLDAQLDVHDCHVNLKSDTCKTKLVKTKQIGMSKRSSISHLAVVEVHSLLIAIIAGMVIVCDADSLDVTARVDDSYFFLFATFAPRQTVILFPKKKARVYFWKRSGLLNCSEQTYMLSETPSQACCLDDKCIVVANKKSFDILRMGIAGDYTSCVRVAVRTLLDTPRGATCMLIAPGDGHLCGLREWLLVSSQTRGTVFRIEDILRSPVLSLARESCPAKRLIAWSGTPTGLKASSAFLLALLECAIQVHYLPTLAYVQTISLAINALTILLGTCDVNNEEKMIDPQLSTSKGVLEDVSITTSKELARETSSLGLACPAVYCIGANTGVVVRMSSIDKQSRSLLQSAMFADALGLRALSLVSQKNEKSIEERYAYICCSQGDFNGALHHWLNAETKPEVVAGLFAFIKPPKLVTWGFYGGVRSGLKKLGAKMSLQMQRSSFRRAAETALTSYFQLTRRRLHGLRRSKQMLCDGISLKAQLLLIDTMLVAVWLWCIPPRFANISNFLRNPTQKCDLQAIAPLLAAEGVEHAAPLIWLYRSKHAHKCALELVVKVSCFANVFDAWDHLQSLHWRARYLQSLWWSRKSREMDLAINHVIRMFPVAPALGLAVLTGTKIITHDDDDDNDRTWQGSGNTENVARLNDSFACIGNLELSPRPTWANHRLSSCLWDPLSALNFYFCATAKDSVACWSVPLENGATVAFAYLEYTIYTAGGTCDMHNKYLHLLLGGLEKASDINLIGAYQARLCHFLRISTKYDAAASFPLLPAGYLHERGIVLSRISDHPAVLNIYSTKLRDDHLAETYCSITWKMSTAAYHQDSTNGDNRERTKFVACPTTVHLNYLGIYITLARCYATRSKISYVKYGRSTLAEMLDLICRHTKKIDLAKVLSLFPNDVALPLCMEFLKVVVSAAESKQRIAMGERNLRKVELVTLKYLLLQHRRKQQSSMITISHQVTQLGIYLRLLRPVVISKHAAVAPCHVACTAHMFESYFVLQFRVTNNTKGEYMQNIRVSVDPPRDKALFVQEQDQPLRALRCKSTGMSYVILRSCLTASAIKAPFACKLCFVVIPQHAAHDSHMRKVRPKEIPLENLNISIIFPNK